MGTRLSRSLAPCLALASTSFAQTPLFPGETVPTAGEPWAIATADMDSDGLSDVVVVSNFQTGLSVLLGDGAGGFTSGPLTTTQNSFSAAVGDIDGDGDLDVVLEGPGGGGNDVSLFLGDGLGGLALFGTLDAGGSQLQVEAGDLNADGELDVAVRDGISDPVKWSPGLGGGAFGAFLELGPFQSPKVIDIGDATGDGVSDLLVGEESGRVHVLAGGLGAPAPPITISACAEVFALAVEDVTGNGGGDLLVGCGQGHPFTPPASSFLEVHAADGSGGWLAPVAHELAGHPRHIAAGDVDADGWNDAVVATGVDHALLLGSAGGLVASRSFATGDCLSSCGSSAGIALADVDLDGRADLLSAEADLRLLRGSSAFLLSGARRLPISPPFTFGAARDVAAVDLDGNGRTELVAPDEAGGLTLLALDGLGEPLGTSTAPGPGSVDRIRVAELNGDGVADLVSTTTDPAGVHVQLADGSGGLLAPSGVPLVQVPFEEPPDLDLGDLDGDGLADVAVADANGVRALFSDGAGGFGGEVALEFSNPSPRSLCVGDANLDGALDIVAMGYREVFYPFSSYFWDPTYRAFLGDGAGGFDPQIYLTGFDLRAWDMGMADLDVDGSPELVVAGDYQVGYESIVPRVRVYPHGGLQGSALAQHSGGESSFEHLWLADVDGDGAVDVLTGGRRHVELFRGGPDLFGGGPFLLTPPERVYSGPDCAGGVLVDLGADGWLDLVRDAETLSFSSAQQYLSVLPNPGAPTTGAVSFGGGSPGCSGRLGLAPNGPPDVGASGFALVGSGVAPGSSGWGFLGALPDLAGTDPLGLGLVVHLAMAGGSLVPFEATSGAGGDAWAPLPIPNDPGLATQVVYAQTFWLPPAGFACGGALFGLQSSRGLRLVIQ